MASVEQRILDRVESLIGSGAGMPEDLIAHQVTHRAINEDSHFPQVIVYPAHRPETEVDDLAGGVSRTVRVGLVVLVATPGDHVSTDGLPTHVVLDPIYVWIVRRIMAADAFSGLDVDTVHEGAGEWDEWEGAQSVYGRMDMEFEVQYYTDQFTVEAP